MNKFSVMIIDDNEVDRYLLTRHLKKTGIVGKIFEADDGTSAIEFFDNYQSNKQKNPNDFPPVVLFLDVNMPLMDGFEFLDKFTDIRQSIKDQSIVVMMFTSSDNDEEKQRALSYPFVKGFISKSNVNSELLKDKIQSVVVS